MQNIVILAGNIGQAPETRTTQGGTGITHFTLPPRAPAIRKAASSATRTAIGSRTPNGTASPASTASARRSSSIAKRA